MSVIILTRSYCKDAEFLTKNLLSTINVFLNRDKYKFGLILDDETQEDHDLGDMLLHNNQVDNVIYEPLPDKHLELFPGKCWRWGYDRQQWSTFYMDTHVDQDIIGVVDSDSTFTSYLTDENIFTKEGKIKIIGTKPSSTEKHSSPEYRDSYKMLDGSQWPNDDVALKFKTTYDAMFTNIMPIFFHRSSFLNLRNYISSVWNMSFDEAFKIFSLNPYSQFNILVNYVLKFEADKYEFIDLKDPTNKERFAVAQNGCPTSFDSLCGVIQSFSLPKSSIPSSIKIQKSLYASFGYCVNENMPYEELLIDTRHANNVSHFNNVPCSREEISYHYANVNRDVAMLSIDKKDKLNENIEKFLNVDFNNIIMKGF